MTDKQEKKEVIEIKDKRQKKDQLNYLRSGHKGPISSDYTIEGTSFVVINASWADTSMFFLKLILLQCCYMLWQVIFRLGQIKYQSI